MSTEGTPVTGLHPLRRMMPFLMRGRNEAFVLFEQQIPTAPLRPVLERLGRERPPDRRVTFFHCVLYAVGSTLHEFPRLNRFVAGSRLYDRHGIWLSFSGKQRLDTEAPLFTAKIPFRPGEPFVAFVDRVLAAVGAERSGRDTAAAREVRRLVRLAPPLLRLAVRASHRLHARGWLPASLVETDPLHASAFLANLGSVGLDAAWHHLYEHGSIPIFLTMGRLHRAPVVLEDGSVTSREVFVLRYTYDERIEDGFYAARALEHLAAMLARPATFLPA